VLLGGYRSGMCMAEPATPITSKQHACIMSVPSYSLPHHKLTLPLFEANASFCSRNSSFTKSEADILAVGSFVFAPNWRISCNSQVTLLFSCGSYVSCFAKPAGWMLLFVRPKFLSDSLIESRV
jgi:hypothetical protein